MTTEKLVRLSDVEYYLRRTATNILDDVEGKAETLSNDEMNQVGGCVFALRELADNAHRLPTVDTVEVVRCKDCKRRGKRGVCPLVHLVIAPDGLKEIVDYSEDNGFCHYGDKPDGGAAGG